MLKIDANRSLNFANAASLRPPPWLLALALNTAIAFFLSLGAPERYFHPALATIETAPATSLESPPNPDAWDRHFWWETPHAASPQWIRITLNGTALNEYQEPALALSGAFSASVWINGEFAGAKGAPGNNVSAETPGPIDAVITLGDHIIQGRNEILVLTSAFHAGYRPAGLFHALGLREFTSDPRRSLKSYLIAATQTGLIMGLGVLFLYMRRKVAEPRAALWAAAAAAATLGALAAESSRVFINYSYAWQGERQFLIWAMLIGLGVSINLHIASRFKSSSAPLFAALAAALGVTFFLSGTDFRTASGFVCLLVSAVAMLILTRGVKRASAIKLAVCLLPWIPFAISNAPEFVDNGVYVFASMVLLFIIADMMSDARRDDALAHASDDQSAPKDLLCIEGEYIAVAALRAAHAAGNYVELELADGSRKLIRTSLSKIAQDANGALMRVHRSHLVNLSCARRIRAEKGSRYKIILDDNSSLPVSRAEVSAVRKTFAQRKINSPNAAADERPAILSRQPGLPRGES